MSRSLRQVAVFLALGGVIINLTLSLLALYRMFGDWGVFIGLVLFPLTWGYFPFYILFAHGSWILLLITYGSASVSLLLLEIAERMEPRPRLPPEPPTKPVTTNENSVSAGIFLAGGLILAAVILSGSNLTMVAQW